MSPDPSVFRAWGNFYVMTGSAAAALTGLMFVVTTLVAQRPPAVRQSASPSEGTRTFSSPTVVHFCAAFFISGVLAAPWHKIGYAELLVALLGLFGVGYVVSIARRMRRMTRYNVDWDEWLWYVALPMLAYAVLAVAGAGLAIGPAQLLFALGGATMLLIFIGIHNSWDIVTYLVIFNAEE
ncbi:MAG TPA: hypothetical protein VMF11_02635 [Candidatus Baltobacteraceae bacterium]|nr:hypothetical protein [Candidatus Baltobacteraceae bacterium]